MDARGKKKMNHSWPPKWADFDNISARGSFIVLIDVFAGDPMEEAKNLDHI